MHDGVLPAWSLVLHQFLNEVKIAHDGLHAGRVNWRHRTHVCVMQMVERQWNCQLFGDKGRIGKQSDFQVRGTAVVVQHMVIENIDGSGSPHLEIKMVEPASELKRIIPQRYKKNPTYNLKMIYKIEQFLLLSRHYRSHKKLYLCKY